MNKLFNNWIPAFAGMTAKHKRIVMAAGIGLVCLLLAGVRWFSSYSSSVRGAAEKAQQKKSSETPVVASFLCKKVNFTDELVLRSEEHTSELQSRVDIS